jgi:hypothetical protein
MKGAHRAWLLRARRIRSPPSLCRLSFRLAAPRASHERASSRPRYGQTYTTQRSPWRRCTCQGRRHRVPASRAEALHRNSSCALRRLSSATPHPRAAPACLLLRRLLGERRSQTSLPRASRRSSTRTPGPGLHSRSCAVPLLCRNLAPTRQRSSATRAASAAHARLRHPRAARARIWPLHARTSALWRRPAPALRPPSTCAAPARAARSHTPAPPPQARPPAPALAPPRARPLPGAAPARIAPEPPRCAAPWLAPAPRMPPAPRQPRRQLPSAAPAPMSRPSPARRERGRVKTPRKRRCSSDKRDAGERIKRREEE